MIKTTRWFIETAVPQIITIKLIWDETFIVVSWLKNFWNSVAKLKHPTLCLAFLLLAMALLGAGLFNYLHREVQTSHFRSIAVSESSETTLSTGAFIVGQYKTVGEGFFVGKRITISALLYLQDNQLYKDLRDFTGPKIVFIEGSENPDDSERDISEAIKAGNLTSAFTNIGTIEMIEFYDSEQTVVLEGDVIFTKEGDVSFGPLLSSILDWYNLEIEGISIAPSYVKHEIDTNRTILLLAFIAPAAVFLSLFFALYLREET